jgi:flagellar basal body-associated protein FliL
MTKKNKRTLIISLIAILLLALIVLCIYIPFRNKAKAPTRENSSVERAEDSGKINSNAEPQDESLPNAINGTANSPGNSQDAVTPAEQPANPDSSTTISDPQTTDYSSVKGSQFDERN